MFRVLQINLQSNRSLLQTTLRKNNSYSCSRSWFSDSTTSNGNEATLLDQLQKENTELKDQVEKLQNERLYQLAEQENIRKRSRKDVDSAKAFGIERFAKSLFDVAETLKQATQRMEKIKSEADEVGKKEVWGMICGVRMTEQNLLKALRENGVTKYGQPGDAFDPNKHEALSMISSKDSTHPPKTVAFLMTDGWMLNGRVLRAAQVGVVDSGVTPAPETLLERKLNVELDEADELEKTKSAKLPNGKKNGQ